MVSTTGVGRGSRNERRQRRKRHESHQGEESEEVWASHDLFEGEVEGVVVGLI